MTPLDAGLIIAAGLAAGAINTIVGSGSLVTFPTLLALGYAPVTANIANTIGLVPGSASGAIAYRPELVGQRNRAIRLGIAAGLGGLTGGVLLLALPSSAFGRIVPVLILLACVLVALQPRLSRALASRHGTDAEASRLLPLLVYATAIYGGYFGAAQSVLQIAILGVFIPDSLQRLNGLKNVLTFIVNGVAAILFVIVARVAWEPAVLIAVGSIIGGQVGARIGRRMPPMLLRAVIIVVGVIVSVRLLLG